MSWTPRKMIGLAGAAALGVTALTGAASATGSTAKPRAHMTPHFAKLNAQQVKARDTGKNESVVVVFGNQLTNLPANQSHFAARQAAAKTMQAPLVSQLHQVGASKVTSLSLLNAVAATMPAAEAQALSAAPGVQKVVPDGTIIVGAGDTWNTPTVSGSRVNKPAFPGSSFDGQQLCSSSPNKPLLEPEALTNINDASDNPNDPDEASNIATGKGVIVGNVNADEMTANPNMIRPGGQSVVIDSATPTANVFDDEFNGDVSTIAAQGTVTYTYASQLPYSNISSKCTFRIVGDAPGASLVSTGYFANADNGEVVAPESQVIAGLQNAASEGADVVSESYGYGALPGASDDLLVPTNDAMVAAGVVVVESAGDSGSSGTVEAPADDPNVIDVGGTTDLRLQAQAYGYKGWEDDNMTTLSSGGTAPNGAVVDLVAPGYGSLAATGVGGDPNLPTEAFGGTSESAPFVAGAAADVIQAYRDTHGGSSPTPAMVKQILTSTATDIGAPSDQEGAGLLNVYAAVEAARQMPGSTVSHSGNTPTLVDTPSQLDEQANGGSTVHDSVSLYNASSSSERVSGAYRVLGSEFSLGHSVTEHVSAPSSSAAIPAQGATAAPTFTFKVPNGVDVLDADMRWPDPTNQNILAFILVDPAGKIAQESYDYGASNGPSDTVFASPDIQHTTVQHPMAGTWTVEVLWSNGRAHLQNPPDVPGTYTGTMTFQASGQDFTTSRATGLVTIPAHSSVSVPLSINMPKTPGDSPESVIFTGSNGLQTSVPIARRTLIPSGGGLFGATLTSSVSRGAGQLQTFYVNVPAGKRDLDISLYAPDHSADDPVYYYLFDPDDLQPSVTESGNIDVTGLDAVPTAGNPSGNASLIATDPEPGLWEIDVMQGATTDGTEFSQTVTGSVAYNRLAPFAETGIPTSASTTIASGTNVPITVTVKNTTNHVGFFVLEPTNTDITGGATETPVEIAPGATGVLTATLSPTAASGTAASGFLSVVDSTDWGGTEPALELPDSFSDWHDFAYTYTVGS